MAVATSSLADQQAAPATTTKATLASVNLQEGILVEPGKLKLGLGKKTKDIVAKPINTLLCDKRIMAKFLLATLEGSQMLKANSMVCMGPVGDVWQQAKDKLHKQYTPVECDEDGWMTYRPKPENQRDVIEIVLDGCQRGQGEWIIKAQWGERQADGTFIQKGKSGDILARNQDDPTDVWVIDRNIFDNTYEPL